MTTEPLRIVIAGGGTGGHLYPGIAVAREILARQPSAAISFAGTARGIEARVIPREGFALDLIRSRGIKGKSRLDRLRGLVVVPVSLVDAFRILSARRPRLVLGVGGYSAGPVVLAAWLRGVPTMLLEQNAVPGLTNRLLGRFVRAAAVTFEETRRWFGSKAFVSGNPVRAEFFRKRNDVAAEETSASQVRVLIFGGSQGAHAINVAMAAAAPELARSLVALEVTHQTGEADVETVRAAYRAAGIEAEVEAFFFDMGRRVGEADLIICRAGATTIAEVTAAGKPAILIPLPTATDDHQRKNAEALATAGAAEVLLQSSASGHELATRILALATDRERRARLAAAARSVARPDAARAIVDRIFEIVGEQTHESSVSAQ